MPSPLESRVAQVQASARRLVLLKRTGRFVAAATLLTIGFGALGYYLRIDDPLFRWLLSASYWGLVAASCVRLFAPALQVRHDLVATARQIEMRMPVFGGRLSSAIAFSQQSERDWTNGSADLRHAAILQTEQIASSLDFRRVINDRAPRRSLAIATLCLLGAALLVALNPALAEIAICRLGAPWQNRPWPRHHVLAFVEPVPRIIAGDNFEAVLIDRRGALPGDVEIQVRRSAAHGPAVERRRVEVAADRAVFHLENVTQSFEYRARGGDDDTMPWLAVSVVNPPKITDLQVIVRPPAYTGLPPVSEGPHVSALVGSQLEVRGKIDQPIQALSMTSAANNHLPTAALTGNGREFRLPSKDAVWTVDRSETFDFELTAEDGLTVKSDARIDVHALEDHAPSIVWLSPEEHTVLTPRAIVEIRCTVNDDLAVQRVDLRYLQTGKNDEEQTVSLLAPEPMRSATTRSSSGAALAGDERQVTFQWDLAQFSELSAGDSLQLRITAEDYKPQMATTEVRRISVVTAAEFQERIAAHESAVMLLLQEALATARQLHQQTDAVRSRVVSTATTTQQDVGGIEASQYSLLQLRRLLDTGPDGALGRIATLQRELAANAQSNGRNATRLWSLQQELTELVGDDLPAVDQHLGAAARDARPAVQEASVNSRRSPQSSTAKGIHQQLQAAAEREDHVVRALERIVGTLSQSDALSRIARQLTQLRAEEQRLATNTEDLHLKAIGQSNPSAVSDRAAAQQLHGEQLDLARQFDKLQSALEAANAATTSDQQDAAPPLADAASTARRLAIGSRMREAAAHLAQLRFSRASQSEQQVVDALDELLNSLPREDAGRGPNQTAGQSENNSTRGQPSLAVAGTTANPSAASSQGSRAASDASFPASANVEQALRHVWGHLPDKTREQLQAPSSEQFLPKYQRLIEQFYQRLAEEPVKNR
jgi:hypothetical protein